MSDNDANKEGLMFSFNYGESHNIVRDVALFELFYGSTFRDEACSRFAAQVRRQSLIYMTIGFIMLVSCLIPLMLNLQSVFVYVLLVVGLVPLAVTVFYLYRVLTVRQYCENNLDQLLDGQFASSRSESKRIFKTSFYDSYVEVEYGVGTKAARARKKPYSDIEAVYETDDLFFMKGLTWLSKFQMDESTITRIEQIFREKLTDRYVVG